MSQPLRVARRFRLLVRVRPPTTEYIVPARVSDETARLMGRGYVRITSSLRTIALYDKAGCERVIAHVSA